MNKPKGAPSRPRAAPVTAIALYSSSRGTLRLAVVNSQVVGPGTEFASPQEFEAWLKQCAGAKPQPRAPDGKPRGRTAALSLTLPLQAQGETIGFLGICVSKKPSAETRQWLEVLAAQLAAAWSMSAQVVPLSADLLALKAAHELEHAMVALGKMAGDDAGEAWAAGRVLEILYEIVPFERGAIYKRERLTRFSVLNASKDGLVMGARPHVAQMTLQQLPLLHELTASRQPIYLDEVTSEPRWRSHLPRQAAGSWAGIPLVYGKRVVGLLLLTSPQNNFFTPKYRLILDKVSGWIALWMQNIFLVKQSRDESARLSELTQRVMKAQEEERKRVSRELHDEAGQSLTALTLTLEQLQDDLAGQSYRLRQRAQESVAMTRSTLERIRAVARTMRPPTLDTLGLAGALEQLAHDNQQRGKFHVAFTSNLLENLSDQISITVYRFVQEALTNATKHSAATEVHINAHQIDSELRVTIRDNGKGFDAEEHSNRPRRAGRLGLLGMRERLALVNGWLDIQSKSGEGTHSTAIIPLPGQDEASVLGAKP